MKGRRRARRLALQALYELDLTAHAVDEVLAHRFEEYYRASAEGALDPADHELAKQLIEAHVGRGFLGMDAAAEAERLGVPPAQVGRVAVQLAEFQSQAEYAADIARGVRANHAALDEAIGRLAPEWPVDQLAAIDRNILRMALWEIGCRTSPLRVAINEAVDLARLYSGESARRMVNGALGAFATGQVSMKLAGCDPED